MKKISFLLFAILFSLSISPANVQYTILSERDATVKAKLGGMSLGSRQVRHIVYEYPSVDPDGNEVTISGVIMAPSDIVDGTVPCDGVIMYNHYTLGAPEEAPSLDGKGIEAVGSILASPLKPNYIVVASDYIGYGSSSNHIAAYLCGDTNARNSLDGLLAAKQLFSDKQIPQGKYLFNIGYSQGGTESMFAAKLTDTVNKYKGIRFDKTFSGGGLLDYEEAYNAYVDKDFCQDLADVVFFIISVNENCHLGIDYNDIFLEPIASKALEYMQTKNKDVLSETGINDMEYVHEVLQPAFMKGSSSAAATFKAKLRTISLTQGWTPDATKKYYIEHSRHDNYVPVQSSRGIIPWMKGKGFTPSLVPGKTTLQTNTAVFKLDHQQSAIVWAIQTLAAIQFWPVLYYEGEQNRYFHDEVYDMNLLKAIKTIESWGIDLHVLVEDLDLGFAREAENGCGDADKNNDGTKFTILSLIPGIADQLAEVDLTVNDVEEMLSDSGITDTDLILAIVYLKTEPAAARADAKGTSLTLEERTEAPLFLLRSYEQKLAAWFLFAGFDVNYNLWGN